MALLAKPDKLNSKQIKDFIDIKRVTGIWRFRVLLSIDPRREFPAKSMSLKEHQLDKNARRRLKRKIKKLGLDKIADIHENFSIRDSESLKEINKMIEKNLKILGI